MNTILETDRLYLREFISQDYIHFYHLNNDPQVLEYTGDVAFESESQASDFLEDYIRSTYEGLSGVGRYAVIRKKDDEFLGWCGLKYHKDKRAIDVGFRFYRCYWDNGYATESAKAIREYAFRTLKYVSLIAHAHSKNIRSQKVLENIDFKKAETITYHDQPTLLYKTYNARYTFRIIEAEETWPVRHPVLRAGRPLEDVYMEADEKESTFHLGAFYEDTIIGVASFMEDRNSNFSGEQARLRGMAVLPAYRRKGVAEKLLSYGERLLKEKGKNVLWFNARIVALSFYKHLGYKTVGEEFEIPLVGTHFVMKKKL